MCGYPNSYKCIYIVVTLIKFFYEPVTLDLLTLTTISFIDGFGQNDDLFWRPIVLL